MSLGGPLSERVTCEDIPVRTFAAGSILYSTVTSPFCLHTACTFRPLRHISAHASVQVFGQLARRIQKAQNVKQRERALLLLLHGLRVSSRQSTAAQAAVYPVLVELLRSKEQHSCQVVQLVLEAVAAIVKQGSAGCSALVNLGVVT